MANPHGSCKPPDVLAAGAAVLRRARGLEGLQGVHYHMALHGRVHVSVAAIAGAAAPLCLLRQASARPSAAPPTGTTEMIDPD